MKKRKYLEWLYFDDGFPLHNIHYVDDKIQKYKDDNPEFTIFLYEVIDGLENMNDKDYQKIIMFNNSEIRPGLVYRDNSIFNTLIEFYNYGFSSLEAIEYIKKLHDLYVALLDTKYLWEEVNRYGDLYEITLLPIKRDDEIVRYSYHCAFMVRIEDNHFSSELLSYRKEYKLMWSIFYRNEDLSSKVKDLAAKYLDEYLKGNIDHRYG